RHPLGKAVRVCALCGAGDVHLGGGGVRVGGRVEMQVKRQRSKVESQKFPRGCFAAFLVKQSAKRGWSYFCLLTFAFCLLTCLCFGQAPGPPSTVYIASPKPELISGEQLQLSATARDGSGRARQGDNFTWVSSNTGILTIDGRGMVTGVRLGIADVTAATGNVRGTVRLQVLPQRIEVTPGSAQVLV